jgi:hypothetical protein
MNSGFTTETGATLGKAYNTLGKAHRAKKKVSAKTALPSARNSTKFKTKNSRKK